MHNELANLHLKDKSKATLLCHYLGFFHLRKCLQSIFRKHINCKPHNHCTPSFYIFHQYFMKNLLCSLVQDQSQSSASPYTHELTYQVPLRNFIKHLLSKPNVFAFCIEIHQCDLNKRVGAKPRSQNTHMNLPTLLRNKGQGKRVWTGAPSFNQSFELINRFP